MRYHKHMADFEAQLTTILKAEKRFLDQDGELLRSNVIDAAYKADRALVELLLSSPEAKKKFFTDINGYWVFDINGFVTYIQDKHFLNDSYTKYRNKIGLTLDGKHLGERGEVALAWPFKDCVLEGGMTKEDEKRKEIFFNQILAQDEIDKLLAPKVFTHWKRLNEKGEGEVQSLKRDTKGILRENFLIKGNNLLALHSLKQQFAGQVKLIYVDPPYNTDNPEDSFNYNDSFTHSTWLTFMRNRLEIARDLLSNDGAIYVQLDYNEVHYCKVLMDEIFGRENFEREIIWRIGWISGYKSADKNWVRNHDTILFYSKDKSSRNFTKKYIPYPKDYVRRDGAKPEGAGYPYEDTWNSSDMDVLNSIAIVSFSKEKVGDFKGQKNEALIQRIIEAHTNEGDVVLDFFSGTGTTASVAHKLKRQWIAVEQMEGQMVKAFDRLKKTINGDQTGISRDVKWKGGGDFVYAELMKYNEAFMDMIEGAKDTKALLKVWKKMKGEAFFEFNVDMQQFEQSIDEFETFPLKRQRQTLCELLNKNQLYVNLSEINDTDFKVSKEDKATSKQFYGK